MSKCLLVGIENNNFTNKNTGELVNSTILHIVYDKAARSEAGFRGQRVEALKVFFDANDLIIGKRYEIIWGSVRYGNKAYSRVEDIQPIE